MEHEHLKRDRMILRELSNDSRVSISKIATLAGCSRVTAKKIIDKLQQDLKIAFTLELDENKLGATERHIIAINFTNKPSEKEIREYFNEDLYAQDVYMTQGNFDLIVYATATEPENYIIWETKIASHFSEYGIQIRPSEYVVSHFGYLPVSNSLISSVKDNSTLDEKDKKILCELNQDSRMSYRELSKRTGINDNVIRYRIFALQKAKIIKRFTIGLHGMEEGVASAYFINYRFTKLTTIVGFPNSRAYYLSVDGELPLFNSFQLIAPISGSFRSFGITYSANEKEALEKTVRKHRMFFRNENIEIKYVLIKKVIKGLLPFRNLDIKSNYKTIDWKT